MRQALFHRALPPLLFLLRGLGHAGAGGLQPLSEVHEALGAVRAPVEQHVLHEAPELGIDLLVHLEHSSVDDAHVHPGLDGVVEEGRVHRLADVVVPAEAEGHVGHAAADLGVGQIGLDPARGGHEVHGVVVVLLDACRDGEHVGIEDDVLGRQADLVDEDPIGALADPDLVLVGRGLTLLVEGHDHDGGAVLEDRPGVLAEFILALLERDRVDDPLALKAFQASFNDLPLRRVHHEGHLGHLGLAGEEQQEARHGSDAVDHPLIHADVDDVGAVLHLLARDAHRLFVLALLDELGEAR